MKKELNIDRAVYLVDEGTRTYRFVRRNSDWKGLDPDENERNKRHIDGYTRILANGKTRVFRYRHR